MFPREDIAVMRRGPFKLIWGATRDSNWYREPVEDWLNSSDDGWMIRLHEAILRGLEYWYGEGPFDSTRLILTHKAFHERYVDFGQTLLFDLEKDERETTNLADEFPNIVRSMQQQLMEFKKNRPRQVLLSTPHSAIPCQPSNSTYTCICQSNVINSTSYLVPNCGPHFST